jgi:hypothetical protein
MNRILRLQALVDVEIKKMGAAEFARQVNAVNLQRARDQAAAGGQADPPDAPPDVDRRVLQRIAERPESVHFTLALLTALDAYFAPRGEGLQDKPIFARRGVLECLVEKGKVAFLLGARPRAKERRNDLSRWDTRSMAVLLRNSCACDLRVDYAIEDVLLDLPMTDAKARRTKWHGLLQDSAHSLVAIGSPKVNAATEAMLAAMFDAPAFRTPLINLGEHDRLPFYFAWPTRHPRRFQSAFALTARELAFFDPRVARALEEQRSSAFVLGEATHEVQKRGQNWEMYGTIVAQRRSGGNVWLVVSGLTGPATYAAATLVRSIDAELPWVRGQDSPVLWLPIKAVICANPSHRAEGDDREVVSCSPVGLPRIWPAPRQEQPPRDSARD